MMSSWFIGRCCCAKTANEINARVQHAKRDFFMGFFSDSSIAIGAAINRFDDNCRTVGEHFGYSLHDFVRVVARTDDGIGADFRRMLNHNVNGLASRLVTELGEDRDVAANQRLQARANKPDDRTGTDGDAAYDPQVSHNAEPGQLESGRHHMVSNRITRLCDLIGCLSMALLIHLQVSSAKVLGTAARSRTQDGSAK